MDLNIYALGKDEGPAVWFLNQLVIVKATAKQTNNGFGLVEMLAPVGPGSPYHVHHAEDETFYLLEGQLEVLSGERRLTGGPGTFVFLPRNIPHGFRVVGTSPARFLVLTTPGGFEGFFMEVGRPASTRTLPAPSAPDMEKLMALQAKYRLEILGPLPE
jgi:quercetin dioxygenase-like cupin family protein